jgi:ribonuclease HI
MFNFTLRGDGSGTIRTKPCGYAVAIFNSVGERIHTITNGTSNGTNNFAELLPYVNTLWFLHPEIIKNKETLIEIISDSEVTVKTGNGEYQVKRENPNCILWYGLIEFCKTFNVKLTWRHIYRNTDDIATEMDKLAKDERKKVY